MISLLISLLIMAVVVYVLFLIIGMIPMDVTIKRILVIIVSLIVFVWLLQALGVWTGFHGPILR